MKDWRTSFGGCIAAIGLSLQATDNPATKAIGWIVAGIGALITGFAAKDAKKVD